MYKFKVGDIVKTKDNLFSEKNLRQFQCERTEIVRIYDNDLLFCDNGYLYLPHLIELVDNLFIEL